MTAFEISGENKCDTTACHRHVAHITGRLASRNWRCVRVCLFSSHFIYTSHYTKSVNYSQWWFTYENKNPNPKYKFRILSRSEIQFLYARWICPSGGIRSHFSAHCVCVCAVCALMCVRVAINQPYKYISSVNDPPHFHFGILRFTFGDALDASLRNENYFDFQMIHRKIVDDRMDTKITAIFVVGSPWKNKRM